MTYPTYTRQQIQFLSLTELKAIATQLGIEPADKRSKASHITAILDHSQIEIADEQPVILAPTITTGRGTRPSDYKTLCHLNTGTRSLHQLEYWCKTRQILQTESFDSLYRNILNYNANFPYEKAKQLDLTFGCIDVEIDRQSELSEAICDELELAVIDLSIAYDDMAIPDGVEAYRVYYNGRQIISIHAWDCGWVCAKSNGKVYDDPYSAIVNGYELYNPGAVLLARMTIERDKEIETARAELMPNYV
jgi:hypothetical protein